MRIKTCKKLMVLLLTAVMQVTMTACSIGAFSNIGQNETEDNQSFPSDENLVVVGISQVGSESAWRFANTQSIQQAFSPENGFFMVFDNARQRQENQIKAVRSFISQRVDYIVIAPVIEEGWETVLSEARDAQIPVIIMDRMISVQDESLYTTHVGTDQKEEGVRAGRWLEEELAKTGRDSEQIDIVVLQGTKGSSAQRGRSIGFNTVYEAHDNWKVLAQHDGDFTISKGKEEMEKILKKHPDFDVLICQNDDMAIGAIEVLKAHGISTGINGDVIVISFDATKEGLAMVQDGVINVDVECNPLQGDAIRSIINELEEGKTVDKEYFVDEKVFTIDNVEEYIDSRAY